MEPVRVDKKKCSLQSQCPKSVSRFLRERERESRQAGRSRFGAMSEHFDPEASSDRHLTAIPALNSIEYLLLTPLPNDFERDC
jgi:hypothetical protein